MIKVIDEHFSEAYIKIQWNMRGGYEDTELGLYTLLTKYRQTHKNLPSNVYTIITKDQLKLDYYLYSYDVVIMVCRTIVYKN